VFTSPTNLIALNRIELIDAISRYDTPFREEAAFLSLFSELLAHPRAYFRDHLPGHITASSWIVDEKRKHVLLVYHAKLNRWLQPGGHADGDENIIAVARKEVAEETGLTHLNLAARGIFDLDVHTIPARQDFPEHLHYDVRFCFQASMSEPLTINEESHDLRWVEFNEVNALTGGNKSIQRMIEKSQR